MTIERERRLHAVLQSFAQQYRVRITRDECGDPVILGKVGQIYPYTETRLRLLYMPERRNKDREQFQRLWENREAKLAAAGFKIYLSAHGEGIAIFDPQNAKQAALAIEVAEIRQRRVLSPEHLAKLAEAGSRSRFQPNSTALIDA